jgi:hypothetical protein
MAKGDKITGVPYKVREDGVQLIRFAQSAVPQFKIRQDQTGVLYDEAIDVEGASYTYTETDIPAESDVSPSPIDEETVQKAQAYDILAGQGN